MLLVAAIFGLSSKISREKSVKTSNICKPDRIWTRTTCKTTQVVSSSKIKIFTAAHVPSQNTK